MQSFIRRPSRRAAIITGVAGLAVVGAVGIGAAAFAEGTVPTPGSSQSAMPAPSGAPSGAPGAGHHGFGGPDGTHSPHIGGTVESVSGTTVTVKDRDGFTRTITLGSSVKVTKSGSASSTSAITKGTWIEASGTVDSNGTTLDATAVSIGRPTPPKGGPARMQGVRPTPPNGGARPTPPNGGEAPSSAPSSSTAS